jgi:hypothetical protein
MSVVSVLFKALAIHYVTLALTIIVRGAYGGGEETTYWRPVNTKVPKI